jgi:hypothetical protein
MIGRDEIGRLCLEHDRFMAEARESLRTSPVSAFDPGALVYKDHDNNAPEPPSEGDPWAGWTQWLRGHLDLERQSFREEIENALVDLIGLLRRDWEADIRKAATERDAEIAHLRGQVEVLTRLYAGKSADVHDLPNWRPKDVA